MLVEVSTNGGSPTESAFVLAFSVIAGSLVLSIIAALAIPRPGARGKEAMAPADLVGAESG